MKGRVKAVAFDLWDTVFIDDSDEPKRGALGLSSKRETRRELLHRFLQRHGEISRKVVDAGYDVVDAAFGRVWHTHHTTWTVAERLSVLLKGLGRTLPEPELEELVRLHEEMELQVQPDLARGVAQAIRSLVGRYKLCVISDAIFSPGRVLRRILEDNDLLSAFDGFVFSDEAGLSKPRPEVFEEAGRILGVPCESMVHLGDREDKDIAGAHAAGARAVLVTVVKDRGSGSTKADAVLNDYTALAALIETL